MQIEVVPITFAEKNMVGSAREDPNCNPYLPTPIGRFAFSLNPLKLLEQLLDPNL